MTTILRVLFFCVVSSAVTTASAAQTDPLVPQAVEPYPDGLLRNLRAAANDVPGALPNELRYVTVAESHRPLSAVLEGGSSKTYVQARTAFQLVYDAGTIMIDAGMDEDVHRGFSTDSEEPYFADANTAVQAALKAANLVVVTHEHGDHVAGVVRSPYRRQIAAHTVLTKAQVDTLVFAPQSPLIALTPAEAAEYRVIDYARFQAIAPGVVLLKAPGHTPGHQMVFVRLASGSELILSGDVSWALDGIANLKQRPLGTSNRIREDRDALAQQIRWLNSTMTASDVTVIPSHDTDYLAELERRGLVRHGLAIE